MPDVIGAIRDKWLALGGAGGLLGQPLDIERPTFDGVGRAEEFQGGTVSWHPQIGAFAVWGDIRGRWIGLGREQYGYPLTDETGCPDGRGRFNHFRAMQLPGTPDASIYWTPQTAAQPVYGGIRAEWAARGWETSIGYPTEAEHDRAGTPGRAQNFERGQILWAPDTGAFIPTGQLDFDFPSITFGGGVPVGGFAHLTLFQDGNYKFTGHLHDSGATEYNVAAVIGVKDGVNRVYTFQTQGHVAGTFESGSRDYNWSNDGQNDLIAKQWVDLEKTAFGKLQAAANLELVNVTNSLIGSLGTILGIVAIVIA
jgi:LGFP repeat